MVLALEFKPMAKANKKDETMSVKLSTRALAVARIAAATRGESLAEYASRILIEAANRDLDAFNATRAAEAAKPRPPKKGSPK
jgi:hypothetical protein